MRVPLALPLLIVPAVCLAQAPVIGFEKAHHDFGQVLESGPKVSWGYRVVNRGQAALRVSGVKASCGCSSVSVGRRGLAPGEETVIEVTFDPKGLSGNVHKTLEVLSNDPAAPSARITFEATVLRGIEPSANVVSFRGVGRDAKTSADIRLRSMDGHPVEVTSAKIPNAPHTSCTHSRDGLDAVLDIAFDGGLIPKFSYNGTCQLTVITKNHRYPKFEFKIIWDTPAPVSAEPSRVTLIGGANSEARAVVVVSSADGAAFRILRAVPSSPIVKVEGLGGDSATSHTLEIAVSKIAKAGGYNETVKLHLDHPEQREVEIAVAIVFPPAQPARPLPRTPPV